MLRIDALRATDVCIPESLRDEGDVTDGVVSFDGTADALCTLIANYRHFAREEGGLYVISVPPEHFSVRNGKNATPDIVRVFLTPPAAPADCWQLVKLWAHLWRP